MWLNVARCEADTHDMALEACPDCGGPLPSRAISCPTCGYRAGRQILLLPGKPVVWAVAFLAVIVFVVMPIFAQSGSPGLALLILIVSLIATATWWRQSSKNAA